MAAYELLPQPFRYNIYRKINHTSLRKPIQPWAFIRAKNEITTIKTALNSILPAISKGVIGYHVTPPHEPDDGTEAFILDFCRKNPGFIPYKYPYEVIPADSELYKENNYPLEQRLDYYYNAVLSQIPDGEWFIKIDCDHIYDAEKLKKAFSLIRKENECICLTRINLHIKNNQVFFIKDNPFTNHQDHWILKKTPTIKFFFRSYYQNEKLHAWETLSIRHLNWIFTDLTNWHFPLMKKSRIHLATDDNLLPLSQISQYIDCQKSHIPADMLDEQRILSLASTFNYQSLE